MADKYRKVITTTRFETRGQNNLQIDHSIKAVLVGAQGIENGRYALIGKILEQNKAFSILDYEVRCDVSFPHVIGIFGSRGSGKSFDLGIFVEGVFGARSDEPSVRDAGIIFDVQDQFWTLAFEPSRSTGTDGAQLDALSAWGIVPRGMDELAVYVPKGSDTQVQGAISFTLSPSQLSPSDWLAITELERFSSMGQALLTLIDFHRDATPGQLAALCVPGAELSAFQQNSIEGLRWRLDGLEKSGIISAGGIEVTNLLRPGSLSVVLMRNLSEAIRGLVVGVVARLVSDKMGRLQQARKVALRTQTEISGGADELTNRVWLVLDEAHVLVPSDGSTAATAPLIDYVKRGRDAGLSLVFATQQPSAVNSKLLSQVDLTITHRLGFEADLSAAIARMPARSNVEYDVSNERASSLSDVLRSLGPGEACLADSASGRVFLVKMRPRTSAHGGGTPS